MLARVSLSVKLAEPTMIVGPVLAAGVVAGTRPLSCSHCLATSSGSFLSTSTCLLRSVRSSVVILALTLLTRSANAWPYASAVALLTTGVTLSAGCRFLSSSSSTQPLAAIWPSVVKSRPTWMSPFLSAATVSGPPESSDLKSLNFRP